MASIFSAESAVVDNGLRNCLLLCKETLALAGDRGVCVESGGHKISVFPASKANSPPQAMSWRRSGAAAAATTKGPSKHRAATHEPLRPSQEAATPPTSQAKEQLQPETSRQRRSARRAVSRAAAALAASLPPLPPSEPATLASSLPLLLPSKPGAVVLRAVAVATVLPPGLGAASSKRRAPFGPESSKRMALDSSSFSSSSPGPVLALEVGPAEDMPSPSIISKPPPASVPPLRPPTPSPPPWRGELLQLSTRLRSTASRSS